MNEAVIKRMASDAGLPVRDSEPGTLAAYIRFARLVADAERDYCAEVCEDMMEWGHISPQMAIAAGNCADLIRERGGE